MVITNGDHFNDEEATGSKEVEEPLIFHDYSYSNQLLHSLNLMRKNRTFCDVILHVSNTELYAHRAVLASVSSKLMALFSVDDEEKVSNPQGHTVQITLNLNPNFEVRIVEKIINYAYTAQLEVHGQDVQSVYLAASYLKVNTIAKECAKYLIMNLSVDNCIEIRSLPGISSNHSFVCQLDDFISTQFKKVCETPAFLLLPCVQIEILTQTRQEMCMMSSQSLSLMVMDWIKRIFSQNRATTYESFIDKTHMLYLALDNSLQDCSELPTGDVSDTQRVQEYKKMSKKPVISNVQNGSQRLSQMQPAKPRVLIYNKELADTFKSDVDSGFLVVTTDKLTEYTFLSLVVLNERLSRLSIMLKLNYGVEENTETPLQSRCSSHESIPDTYCSLSYMSSGKCGFGCVTFNGCIFVCGGYDRVECLKTVEKYNPENNSWQTLPSMLEARGRFGVCISNKYMYAVGGSNGSTELSTVECYDSEKEKWLPATALPIAKSNAGVCSLSDKIYCIGGWNGEVGIKYCDVYDPESKKWTSIAPLQTGRYQAGVCAFGGLIYAVGGYNAWNCLNSVECYDPRADLWTYSKPLVTARRGCGVVVFNDELYVVGGSDGSSSLETVEVFDPGLEEWRLGATMTTARCNVGVAVLDDRLYAVGGFSGKKFLSSIEFLEENIKKWTSFTPKSGSAFTTFLSEGEIAIKSGHHTGALERVQPFE